MQDEVRITVIATGFDDDERAVKTAVQEQAPEHTVRENDAQNDSASEIAEEEQATEKDKQGDDMEVPVFLRDAAATPRKIF